MNIKSTVRILRWLAVIGWMIVIFCFSAQPSNRSLSSSDPITDAVIAVFHPEYGSLSPDEQFELHESVSFYVRKTAHFTVYAILGLLLLAALNASLPARYSFPAAFVIGTLYAITDEIHQAFVPGRACQGRDVLIDSLGILSALLIAAVIRRIRTKRNRKKEVPPDRTGSE